MPGWASRRACSSTMSLARSMTAACTRSFLCCQLVPPSFDSSGSVLAPPTYFCTRSILEAGT